ncbi:MAG: hypothetical protein AAF826_09225 [Pseudomonadota bacterium]
MTPQNLLMIVTLFCAGFALAKPVYPNAPPCGPRENIIKVLNERYKESLQSTGYDGANRRLEIFANSKTGSWSLVVSISPKHACIMASGRSFSSAAAV